MSKENDLPTKVFHYTSFLAFENILRSGYLRASNASFLNDRRELIHAFEAAKVVLLRSGKVEDNDIWLKAITAVLSELETNGFAKSYISCFCKANDSLTMWRGYAQGLQGVALGFRRTRLESWLKRHKPYSTNVIYGNVSTVSKVQEFLMNSLADAKEWGDIVGDVDDDFVKKEARDIIKKMLPKFKHWGFRDEREFRLVFNEDDGLKQEIYVKSSSVIPYIEVGNSNEKMPIESITVGPGIESEFTQKSVEVLLSAYGFHDVEVRLSAVPFRA